MGSLGEAGAKAMERVWDRPRTFAVGLGVAVLTGGAVVLAATSLPEGGEGHVAKLRTAASVFVAFEAARAVLVGPFVGATRPLFGPREDWTAVREGALDRAWEYLVGGVVVRAAGAVVALAALVGLLGIYLPLATGLQALGYAGGRSYGPMMYWTGLGGAGIVLAALTLGTATAAGAEGRLREGHGYGTAVRGAVRDVAARPHWALVRGFVCGMLWLLPVLTVALYPLGVPVVAVAFVLVGVVTYTVAPAYRSVAAERAPPSPRVPSRARVALVAGLLVGGLLVGATVRVADVRPGAAGPPGFDADAPQESLKDGLAALSERSHTTTVKKYVSEPPTADRHLTNYYVQRHDHADRRTEMYFVRPEVDATTQGERRSTDGWRFQGTYLTEGNAMRIQGGPVGDRPDLEAIRSRSEWVPVENYPNYGEVRRYHGLDLGYPSLPEAMRWQPNAWRVVDRSGGTVTFETTGNEAFARLLGIEPSRVASGSATLVVDAETGHVVRFESTYVRRNREENRRVHTVATFGNYGSTDVTRPPGAPPRGPVAYLYDAALY